MQAEQYFRTATLLFYQGNYEQALISINRYLQIKASNSLGYNNRALIHFHMGNSILARQDIKTALNLNHLNYVAYFNLFSVEAREKDYKSALIAIQSALACVMLIKGRLSNDKLLVKRSMELTEGNFEALVLYILMEIRENRYQEALNVLSLAQIVKQNKGIIQNIVVFIKKLSQKYQLGVEQALYDYLLDLKMPQQRIIPKRQVIMSMIEQEIHESINKCVQQFNQFYSQINKITGGASYLKAKTPEVQISNQQLEIHYHQNKIQKTKGVTVLN